jgi:hypothetical protein
VLFTESTSGYANAPMAAYLVLGGLAVVEGGLTSSKRELLIGGLLLGLGCWTRVEGVLYAAAIVVAGLAALAALRRPDLSWGWVLVPLGVLVAPWLVFYRLYGSDSSQAMGAFASAVKAILAGQWQLGSLRLVLEKTVRAFADAGSWRWVWVASALLVLIGFRGAPRRARLAFLAALAMGAATILVTIMLFYLGSFGTPDLRGWLDRGFDREVLASPVLILSGILLLLAPTSPSPETAGDGEGGGAGSLRQRSA